MKPINYNIQVMGNTREKEAALKELKERENKIHRLKTEGLPKSEADEILNREIKSRIERIEQPKHYSGTRYGRSQYEYGKSMKELKGETERLEFKLGDNDWQRMRDSIQQHIKSKVNDSDVININNDIFVFTEAPDGTKNIYMASYNPSRASWKDRIEFQNWKRKTPKETIRTMIKLISQIPVISTTSSRYGAPTTIDNTNKIKQLLTDMEFKLKEQDIKINKDLFIETLKKTQARKSKIGRIDKRSLDRYSSRDIEEDLGKFISLEGRELSEEVLAEVKKTAKPAPVTIKYDSKYYTFLDKLRESGVTNMFGASAYLKKAFPSLNDEKAKAILVNWMETFGSRKPAYAKLDLRHTKSPGWHNESTRHSLAARGLTKYK